MSVDFFLQVKGFFPTDYIQVNGALLWFQGQNKQDFVGKLLGLMIIKDLKSTKASIWTMTPAVRGSRGLDIC